MTRRSLARARDADLALVLAADCSDPIAGFARRNRDLARGFTELLDMSGVGARHRTVQAVFRAVGIEPFPHHFRLALRGGDVDGAAMAVTAGAAAAAVERIAGARLEAGGKSL